MTMTASSTPQVTIRRVNGRYVVQFRGYAPTDRNLTLYRTQYFASLKAAREHANSRILDAMGIF